MSHTHVPSILFCPVGHPDWGGTGIVIKIGVVTVGTDGVDGTYSDGDGEESQQQHPQQLSSPHAASA